MVHKFRGFLKFVKNAKIKGYTVDMIPGYGLVVSQYFCLVVTLIWRFGYLALDRQR